MKKKKQAPRGKTPLPWVAAGRPTPKTKVKAVARVKRKNPQDLNLRNKHQIDARIALLHRKLKKLATAVLSLQLRAQLDEAEKIKAGTMPKQSATEATRAVGGGYSRPAGV